MNYCHENGGKGKCDLKRLYIMHECIVEYSCIKYIGLARHNVYVSECIGKFVCVHGQTCVWMREGGCCFVL